MSTFLIAALIIAALSFVGFAAEGEKPHGEPNRLINETSPYLLQHAYNPVDWWPWGEEAFKAAKEQDKPIFLSVGYSTCHWCHVMERESFETQEVADVLNAHFICIKVDREELPDVDQQYMLATQIYFQMIGQNRAGGWPNSVWLTPDGRPWYAGTYFPKPTFINLLQQLHGFWTEKRDAVNQQADVIAENIRRIGAGPRIAQTRELSPQVLGNAVRYFMSNYDSMRGGFGDAPKFPPHSALALIARNLKSSKDLQQLQVFTHTLDAMAAGGVYDHVGGGFHRYSTDSRWFLPHFEKMLYDNAQLIRAYADGYLLSGHEGYRRVIAETFAWLKREMIDAAGGFYSAIDADSEGEEGKFYVWTYDEIINVLGDVRGQLFASVYGATKEGTYVEEATGHRTGANVLYLREPYDIVAKELGVSLDDLHQRLDPLRVKMLEARDKRVHPHLDDKVLSGWNGLMIEALAYAGTHLEQSEYTDAAARAADFILQYMRDGDRLLRTWRKGQAKLPAYIDDYAFFILGLLELHEATGDQKWADEAAKLADVMIRDFCDSVNGGFFFTSNHHDDLLVRAKELSGGGNIPSGNGAAARALVRLAVIKQNPQYAGIAAKTFDAYSGAMWSSPYTSEDLILGVSEFFEVADKLPEGAALAEQPKSDADAFVRQQPVLIEMYASHDRVRPGQTLHVALRIRIDEGWHIYTNDPGSDIPVATAVTLRKHPAATLGEIKFPSGGTMTDPVTEGPINMYEKTITLLVPISIAADARETSTQLDLQVKWQACDDSTCLAPEARTFNIPLIIAAESDALRHATLFRSLGVE